MEEKQISADKAILHLNFANRRMLIALVTVCVTFIITIVVFTACYTVREKNWLDTLSRMGKQEVVYDQQSGNP